MLEWMYVIASVLLVSLVSILGIFTLFMKVRSLNKILLFLVSFATGALLGDAFIHLIPETAEMIGITVTSSILFLSGIIIFFIVEKFICWRHCHVITSKEHPHPIGMMNFIGDGVHNLIDGMLIAGSFMVNIPLGISTTLAILFHEIPQEIGDFGILLHAGYTKRRALSLNFLSAIMALVGALLVLLIGKGSANLTMYLIPVTAGGFIYIAGSDLIPELHKETDIRKSVVQLIAIMIGISVMALLLFLE